MTERYWTAVVLWSLIWGLVILFQKHQQPLAEDHPKPPAGPGTNRGLRALVVGHTPWYFPRRRSHRADGERGPGIRRDRSPHTARRRSLLPHVSWPRRTPPVPEETRLAEKTPESDRPLIKNPLHHPRVLRGAGDRESKGKYDSRPYEASFKRSASRLTHHRRSEPSTRFRYHPANRTSLKPRAVTNERMLLSALFSACFKMSSCSAAAWSLLTATSLVSSARSSSGLKLRGLNSRS